MAYRHSKGVGGVIGLRDFFKIQHNSRHFLNLLFLRSAVTDNALLHLKGCIFKNRHFCLLCRKHKNASRLRYINRRFLVSIEKKLFNRHCVGMISVNKHTGAVINPFKSFVERGMRFGGYRTEIKNLEVVVMIFNNTVADYRIAGVNSENYHFLFDSLSRITILVGVPSRPKVALI